MGGKKMSEKPTFSVVVPIYNSEQFLEKCLKSLRYQTFKDFELLTVDDGSTDRSPKIAQKYGKLIKTENHSGAGAARNLGAKNAKGIFLAFTDSDCVVPRNWLQNFKKKIIDQKVVAVGGGYSRSESPHFIAKFNFYELKDRRKNIPKYTCSAVANNLAIKKDIFQKLGGFPEKFKSATAEDLILSFRAHHLGKIIWDKKNGVRHHFNCQLKGYLYQQLRFARDGVVSLAYCPEMLRAKTHVGGLYLQVAYFLLLVIGVIFYYPVALLAILLLFFSNFSLLRLFYQKENLTFSLKGFFLIILRNFVWFLGGSWGILKIINLLIRENNKEINENKN